MVNPAWVLSGLRLAVAASADIRLGHALDDRRTAVHSQARSRSVEQLAVVVVLVFGILIAPTMFGLGGLRVVGRLVDGFTQCGR
jgi:hypothetical protein